MKTTSPATRSLPVLPPADPNAGVAMTPIAFAQSIVLGYRKYGMDPSAALLAAHITPAQLKNPKTKITAGQMEILSAYAMQELDDEALGWFSRKLPWGSYGMLCRASLTANNLGTALQRWCRHHRLLTDEVNLSLSTSGNMVTLSVKLDVGLCDNPLCDNPLCDSSVRQSHFGDMHELCLVTCLRYALGYSSWLVDSAIALQHSSFPYPAPPHAEAYSLMFPGPVEFGTCVTHNVQTPYTASVTFDKGYLDLPVRRDEASLQQMLKRALLLTVLQYRRDRLLVQKVQQILKQRCQENLGIDTIAQALNVSTRTLQRRLKEEDASLNQLKEDARKDRACELLHKSRKSVKQIAAAVGYQNQKSFTRAFKEWTNHSPTEFRKLRIDHPHSSVEP
ncbi:MAG: AraC family transcriptional regulator [Limnobacter sp.]|nr:AraC family transcriptional regulator [Limnobacter sp.]